METRAAGRPSSPGWTPDIGSGLIVACSLLLAATVVVGRGVEPVAAMLIVLSAARRMAPVDSLVAGPGLPRHRERALRPRRTVRPGGQAAGRPGVLPDSRSRWSCSCGWHRYSSIRGFACVGPHSTGLSCSSSPHRSALLPSTSDGWRRSPRPSSRASRSSFPSSSSSISSPASSRRASAVVAVTKFIVSGAAVVAAFAVVEQRTGFNVFDHVRTVLPFLQLDFSYFEVRGSSSGTDSSGPPGLQIIRSRSVSYWRCVSRSGLHSHDRDRSCGRSLRSSPSWA